MRQMTIRLALLGVLAGGLLVPPQAGVAQQRKVPRAAVPLQNLSEAFAAVAEHVKPTVVYIMSGRQPRPDSMRGPQLPPIPPGLERYFPNLPQREPEFQESAGSGFIVSRDGYILTNNHVVDGSDQVTVRLLDRREYKAKVVGTDPSTDLAVVKIDAPNLTPAEFGNSDAVRVGEWVLAVGNPLGRNLTFTVTSGIVSAKGRSLALPNTNERTIQDFIQTDAAINPGNSGGPLVNVHGEVIGINSAIASSSGFYAGYGFAIPINLARQVMEQIIQHGRVQRVALGVIVGQVTPNDAAYVGLPDIRGVSVQDVPTTSPAAAAGIEAGDIIISVDGQPVDYVGQLQQRIAFRKPGETAKIEIARKGGVRRTITIKLQALPSAPKADSVVSVVRPADDASIGKLGVRVVPADADAIRELELGAEQQGPIVVAVNPGGPSWEELADPQQGGPDIILSVEGTRIKTPEQLVAALAGFKSGDIVSLRVYNPRIKARRIERIKLGE